MAKSIHTPQYQRLCNLLIDAREAAGLTQAELAKALDKPQSFVSKYERRERRLDVVELVHIANRLGANPCDIINTIEQSET